MLLGLLVCCAFSGIQNIPTTFVTSLKDAMTEDVMAAIMLFTIMSSIMTQTGIITRLVNILNAILGRLRGGPAYVSACASALFGMVSGASSANAATVGSITIPWMRESGWSKEVAATMNTGNAGLGICIPPSSSMFLMLGLPAVAGVVEAGDLSRELCGGCHVNNTAEIGFLKITSESSVGANVRRIEAVTSYGALAYVNKVEAELKEAAATLRVPPFDVSERVAADQKALKEMRTKAKRAKSMIGDDMFATLLSQVQLAPAGYPVIIARTEVRDGGQMRNMWDVVRSRMDAPGAMVVAGVNDGKPVLMAAGTDEAVAAGFNAGAIIKAMGPAIQGGGGGKPTMAQAGGKDASGIDAALQAARDMLL